MITTLLVSLCGSCRLEESLSASTSKTGIIAMIQTLAPVFDVVMELFRWSRFPNLNSQEICRPDQQTLWKMTAAKATTHALQTQYIPSVRCPVKDIRS